MYIPTMCFSLFINFCARLLSPSSSYVIVVEHDLSVLDYLSDFVCVLYGMPGAYGVVTMPFSVREGMLGFYYWFLLMSCSIAMLLKFYYFPLCQKNVLCYSLACKKKKITSFPFNTHSRTYIHPHT